MPTASGRARAIHARKVHEYMHAHVIPALEPAFAELQRAGKVPAYMTCTDAVYDHIRFVSESYFKNPLWALSPGPAPDPADDMCTALSSGRSADLLRIFSDAMVLLAPREQERAQKSAADWQIFNTHIRAQFRDEFLHAREKGYIADGIDFDLYWAGIAASNGFFHQPIDHKGRPVMFKLTDLLDAHHTGNQQLVVEKIYDLMRKDTDTNSRHYQTCGEWIVRLQNAAEKIHAARTPEGLQQHTEDLAAIQRARDTIRKLQEPTMFNRLRDAFNKTGAVDRVLRDVQSACVRVLHLDADATVTIANLDTVIENAPRFASAETFICNMASGVFRKVMQLQDDSVTPSGDDLIMAANRDYTVRHFPPFDEYIKERPQMKMVSRIDISKISAAKTSGARVAPLTIKGSKAD